MKFSELCDRLEELGVNDDVQLLARQPALPGEIIDQVFTIEDVVVNNYGQVRLILQPSFDSEED